MGKRFACFTKEQQSQFDNLNSNQQKYVVLRSQGYSKAESYRLAGYKCKQMGVGGFQLETRVCPQIAELISVLTGHQERANVYKEDTPQAKTIDEIASELPIEVDIVSENSALMEQGLPPLTEFSSEDAKRIQFYRQIANGSIKTIKVTKTFDKDGNLTGSKREETSDIETRIKARKEIDRILGLTDVLELGQITGGNIKITIVDATKKDDVDDQRGETINGTTSK